MQKLDGEVICLSQMTAKKGMEDLLKRALQLLIEPTLKEEGCLAYELWQSLQNKSSFTMYERFQSQEALEKHIQMPYIQSFIENEYMTCVESSSDADFVLCCR